MNPTDLIFSVSDFVAVFNQTLEMAYPVVGIIGELSSFRVSKNRWVYFDLKDETASVKFFGTVYNLPGPLEDGLMLEVIGQPRLHPQFGFSVNIMSIKPVGDGSLKRAAQLLEAKLKAEGLFEQERKRTLPYPPSSIGLITSAGSAAYADFIKIISERWSGLNIEVADVQVQGEPAPLQIAAAIEYFNQRPDLVDVLVIVRGGGSAEDLAAFNSEAVTRAVALSRIPTLVAIGHEVDISLAELAADQRASTPSNAAELLVPDKRHEAVRLSSLNQTMSRQLSNALQLSQTRINQQALHLNQIIIQYLNFKNESLKARINLLNALNPTAVLARGYALVRRQGQLLKSVKSFKPAQNIEVELSDGQIYAQTSDIRLK